MTCDAQNLMLMLKDYDKMIEVYKTTNEPRVKEAYAMILQDMGRKIDILFKSYILELTRIQDRVVSVLKRY